MTAPDLHAITVDAISVPVFRDKDISADVLRLDKMHPLLSGNKWFKLRYHLEEARRMGKKHIVTRGGAWSNHIIATAIACQLEGFTCTGIIRGEEAVTISPTLKLARQSGMQLIFISRHDYRESDNPDITMTDDAYDIPEGGYGRLGALGAGTLLDHCKKENYTHILCAIGTGTMMAGIANSSSFGTRVIGITVLKNNSQTEQEVRSLLADNTRILYFADEYHFGGYAKYTPTLTGFMNEWYRQTGIPSDFVYTGKLFFAAQDLAKNNYFPPGSRLLMVHSGGLQGNASLEKGTLIF